MKLLNLFLLLSTITLFAGCDPEHEDVTPESQWEEIQTPSKDPNYILAVPPNSDRLFAAYEKKIWFTDDEGKNWHQALFPADSLDGVANFHFLSPKKGFIAGCSSIFQTTDSGLTWQVVAKTSVFNYAISFSDSLNGYAAGTPSNYINVTHDGGLSWQIDSINTWQPISDYRYISFGSKQHGLLLGALSSCTDNMPDALYRTDDGNNSNWSRIIIEPTTNTQGYTLRLRAMAFTDSTTAYIVGQKANWNTPVQGIIFRSTDAGLTWQPIYHAGYIVLSFFAVSPNRIIFNIGQLGFVELQNGAWSTLLKYNSEDWKMMWPDKFIINNTGRGFISGGFNGIKMFKSRKILK